VVQQVFPCRIQEFPTKYLGAPLSLSRLSRADEQHLVDAVAARIPTWKGGLLTNAARATLTQTILSAISIHVSICCNLSAWAIKQIDKRRRAFLWAGTDSTGGRCKVAWAIVCSPKEHGGLGLPDLQLLGFALRLRWEWLRRTRPDAAWAQLPSRPEHAVAAMFSPLSRFRWAMAPPHASGQTPGFQMARSASSLQTSSVRSAVAGVTA
jgi:hypothetical protein